MESVALSMRTLQDDCSRQLVKAGSVLCAVTHRLGRYAHARGYQNCFSAAPEVFAAAFSRSHREGNYRRGEGGKHKEGVYTIYEGIADTVVKEIRK